MAITGSEFVRQFANKGIVAWEAAALQIAREGGLTPWPFFDLTLSDADGHTCTLSVQSDMLAIGTLEDHVRLPLLPSSAQNILNLTGALLPTPWIVYQIWRAASAKIDPIALAPNRGANLVQYAQHDALIDEAIAQLGKPAGSPAAGLKKHIVVSNAFKPDRVVIFGGYRPDGPDVFDDHRALHADRRQPLQPLSNIHGADYVDYDHGVQVIAPQCVVDGKAMITAELYRHPTLSHLVSNEGPIRILRYPSSVAPPAASLGPPISAEEQVQSITFAPDIPGKSDLGFRMIAGRRGTDA